MNCLLEAQSVEFKRARKVRLGACGRVCAARAKNGSAPASHAGWIKTIGQERAKPGGPQLYRIKSQALQKCNLSDTEKGAEQLRKFSVTLEKVFFPFDLPAVACCSQPHKPEIYSEVHSSAALITDLPNHVTLSLKQRRKSFAERFVSLFVYPPKPNNVQQIYVEMMKAIIFSKSLPLRSQHIVFLLYLGIKRQNS